MVAPGPVMQPSVIDAIVCICIGLFVVVVGVNVQRHPSITGNTRKSMSTFAFRIIVDGFGISASKQRQSNA